MPAELQARLQALEAAKQAGDPVAISSAGKLVIAAGLREIGGIDMAEGSASAAVDAYRRSCDFEESVETRVALASAYLQMQRLDESLSVVTDALVADAHNPRAWYVQGKIWILKQRFEDASKSFRDVLNLQDDLAPSYLLGVALLQLKQYDEARASFQHLLENSANRLPIHALLADAYRAAGYTDDFIRESRQSGISTQSAAGDSPPSMTSIIGHVACLGSAFEIAKATPQERKRLNSRQAKLRTVLGHALNDLGTAEARQQQYSLALAHFHEAAGWEAESPGLLRNTGIAAARAQDYPECIRTLRPVLAANPQDNVARSVLGTALFATHSYAEAAQVFTPLGDSALQLPELAYSWAASLVYINKYPQATSLLNQLEQQQLPADTLVLIAQLWSQMGVYQKTIAACHRALQLNSNLVRAHYYAGLAFLRLERPADAAQELRAELQLDPGNTDTQFNLAFALLQQSQDPQALDLLKNVVAHNPEHAEANYELGKELLTEGKPEESVAYLEAAVRLKPQFEPAHYQLQSVYRALGRKDDADREAKVYRALKAKSRNITLPAPPDSKAAATSN